MFHLIIVLFFSDLSTCWPVQGWTSESECSYCFFSTDLFNFWPVKGFISNLCWADPSCTADSFGPFTGYLFRANCLFRRKVSISSAFFPRFLKYKMLNIGKKNLAVEYIFFFEPYRDCSYLTITCLEFHEFNNIFSLDSVKYFLLSVTPKMNYII